MILGFIGCGNMAQAIMSGVIKSNLIESDMIIGADLFQPTLDKVENDLKIQVTKSNLEVAKVSDVIILAVKPQFYADVIKEISGEIKEDALVISIAPGKTIAYLEELFDREIRLVRTMPNTPALVGEGMTAMCINKNVTSEDEKLAKSILSSFGQVEVVQEYMMDAVTAVSGSSPAYVFMMIEAMADAAVLKGMPRPLAYKFASQAVLGSAKMARDLGKHPGELKDMVTSPAGTTIEAVKVLEREGFRSSIIEAMIECANRSAQL